MQRNRRTGGGCRKSRSPVPEWQGALCQNQEGHCLQSMRHNSDFATFSLQSKESTAVVLNPKWAFASGEASGCCRVTPLPVNPTGPLFISPCPLFKSRLSAWKREIIPIGEHRHLIRLFACRVFGSCWKCSAIPLRASPQ